MRSKVLDLLVALLVLAAPASAGSWDRLEYFGGYAGNGFTGVDLLSYGLYNDYYGAGVGTRLADLRLQTWDIPRKGLPDVSSHGVVIPFPLEARVVLASWEGTPFQDYTSVESTTGRVEFHAWYCPWAVFGDLNEVQPGAISPNGRAPVDGLVYGAAWDMGLGYDAGQLWSVTAGRFEFKTRDGAVYRSRQDGSWYAMMRLYWGRTHSQTIGGSPLNFFRDLGTKLCRLAGRCGTVEG